MEKEFVEDGGRVERRRMGARRGESEDSESDVVVNQEAVC